MTPTRSGSNYSIQSNGSGPGNCSHKSKRQECQPRGEAQMEDARASTSSQRKDRRTSEGLDTHVFQRKTPTDKSLVEKPKHVIRAPEEEVGPREGKQPSGSSPHLQKNKYASTSAKKAQENPKDQPEGQAKVKGKGKAQVDQALPAELQDSQEIEDSHGQCVQYGKNSDGIKNKEEDRLNQSFPKM
ncbi:hypothetical protein O181_114332 [Austropuccinia psidii MF-1]|uniref:Uncharacterized protein n=1 Tax=Austropuccinia psidii MF-1 TaxID=1389203 RepID=A0A9Q3K5E1_9BASI|nr:hypothetical protein [Austropuccinia psidii MF-1]